MEIISDPLSIDELFRENRQYRIPIYQRRYVWREANWDNLWTDISDIVNNSLDLFLGIIVTRRETTGDLGVYDVVDGQQRLTTLQIILCVIRDICKDFGYSSTTIGEASRYLKTPRGAAEPYTLLPKEGADRNGFYSIVDDKRKSSDTINAAYVHFKRKIKDYSETEMASLYQALKLRVKLAQINLTKDDVSEKIFASLNATGRMLGEFDYLRNNLFLRAETSAADFYKDYWLDCFDQDNDWDLDAFLRDFLRANLGPNCLQKTLPESVVKSTEKKPFDVYLQDYSKPLTIGVKYEFEQLVSYAELYKTINDPASEIGRRMQFYDYLDIQRLDAFILFVQHKLELSDSELLEVCKVLDSYIVRRMLCTVDKATCIKEINDFFSKVIDNTEFNAEVTDTGQFSASKFADILPGGRPNEDNVREALYNNASENLNLILYVLYEIESLKRETPLEFKDFKLLHIAPQKSSNYEEAFDLWWSGAQNSIGNMTLVSSEPPANWSECSFDDKKSFLAKDSGAKDFTLNQEICKEFPNSHWGEEQIDERAKNLYEFFLKKWPRF